MSVTVEVRGLDGVEKRLKALDEEGFEIVSRRLRAFALNLVGRIKMRSPVDKGFYRDRWFLSGVDESEREVKATITNNMKYAWPVTYGSEVGKRPWPNAGPRTVQKGNRIYSSQAPDGVVEPELEGWANELAEEIRKDIEERLK